MRTMCTNDLFIIHPLALGLYFMSPAGRQAADRFVAK